MKTDCSICKHNPAETHAVIFLESKMTGYYLVAYTFNESTISFPACKKCKHRVALENHFNKMGSAWIAAGIVGIIIGLMMIAIEIPSVLSGDLSSLLHSPVVGLVFLIPSVIVIWRSYKARNEIRKYLQVLNYRQKGRMGAKLY